MLATITTDFDKIAPRFELQPDQIQILKTPAEFYETLKVSLMYLLPLFSSIVIHVIYVRINKKLSIVLVWSVQAHLMLFLWSTYFQWTFQKN